YYLGGSGGMRTGWQQVDGAWYYLGRSGAMATGWLKAGSTWFYMDRSGAMRTGWQKVDGTWYYLDDSGAMVTGRRVIDGRASSFGSNGAWLGYATSAAGATSTRLAPIMGAPSGTRTQVVNAMVASYQRSGATFPSRRLAAGGTGTLRSFATVVYDEAVAEGVRPEVLFAQMMKETGWLRFGGDVRISQYNFGGLGATGGGVSGASFADVRTGVRAQVQHLRAYADPSASTSTLHRPLVDPRFTYVTKGSARYVEHLGIHENPAGAGWASAVGYGASVRSLMTQIFG
ncbi:glucosaminidase domain-containing protein, partial [Actinomyces radicidentis]|uniref:glucosaminidase domain-containing protein n=2 Tax=Actinomyces radicidentis TaxID=111015 RepID=UPI0026DF2612